MTIETPHPFFLPWLSHPGNWQVFECCGIIVSENIDIIFLFLFGEFLTIVPINIFQCFL